MKFLCTFIFLFLLNFEYQITAHDHDKCPLAFDYVNYYEVNTTELLIGTFVVKGNQWAFLNEAKATVVAHGDLCDIDTAKKHGWNSLNGIMSMNLVNFAKPGSLPSHFVQFSQNEHYSQFLQDYYEGDDFFHHIDGPLSQNYHIKNLLPYDTVAGASFLNSTGHFLQKYTVVKGNQILNMTYELGRPPIMHWKKLTNFSDWPALANKDWKSIDVLASANRGLNFSQEEDIFFTAVKGNEYVTFDLQGNLLEEFGKKMPMNKSSGTLDFKFSWACNSTHKCPLPTEASTEASTEGSHSYMTFPSKTLVSIIFVGLVFGC